MRSAQELILDVKSARGAYIAQITGIGAWYRARWACNDVSWYFGSQVGGGWAFKAPRSSPEQKAPPAPLRTTAPRLRPRLRLWGRSGAGGEAGYFGREGPSTWRDHSATAQPIATAKIGTTTNATIWMSVMAPSP